MRQVVAADAASAKEAVVPPLGGPAVVLPVGGSAIVAPLGATSVDVADEVLFPEERRIDKLDVVAATLPKEPLLLSVLENGTPKLEGFPETVVKRVSPPALDIVPPRNERTTDGFQEKNTHNVSQADNAEKGAHDAELVSSTQGFLEDGHVQKLKKRVSFHDPLVTDVRLAASYVSRKGPVKKMSPLAAMLAAARAAHEKEILMGEKVRGGSDEEGDSEAADGETGWAERSDEARKVQERFDDAVKSAEGQVSEKGIVNLTEVYEREGEEPSRVELTKGFVPDSDVSFEEDSEDYLDLTGNSGSTMGGTEYESEDNGTREDYIGALIEAEREAELEEKRKNAKKSAKVLRDEEKEFGKGFNRGFLGTPAVKTKGTRPSPSEKRRAEERTASSVGKPSIEERVIERVVERRSSKKGGKRSRKPRASTSILELRGKDLGQVEDEAERDVEYVNWGEEWGRSERPTVSKFRQLRNLQKHGKSGA